MLEELGEENIPLHLCLQNPKKLDQVDNVEDLLLHIKQKLQHVLNLNSGLNSDKMEVASRNLLAELKTFIARGNSYAQKEGETDDP